MKLDTPFKAPASLRWSWGLMATVTLTGAMSAPTGPAASPAWIERSQHPVAWMSWGAELRLREEYYNNAGTLSRQKPEPEYNYQRYRTRVWTAVSPWKNLDLNARMTWEFRSYLKPDSQRGATLDEFIFDDLNLKFKQVFDQPLTLTVGRQNLTFGNRWLIWDGTSADGSRTEFFDAARLTYDWQSQKTVVDAIYFDQAAAADRWLPPINDQHKALIEQDERGAIVYLSNTSLPRTQLDAYFIYKHDTRVLAKGNDAEMYVLGARVDGGLGDPWKYRAEFAPELGRKNGRDLRAFGFNSRLSYFVKDSWNHNFRLGYEYLSGDRPNSGADEGWDPLWGRRAQWSELLIYTFPLEERGRSGEWSNLQRVDAGWSFNPREKLEVAMDYQPLFANENSMRGNAAFSADGRFRGHLLTGVLRYAFSERVTTYVWNEFFLPGNYYAPDRRDLAMFFRWEIVLKY